MDNLIKPLGTEITLSTANTVANSTAVRLVNIGANASLITVTVNAVASTITLRSNSEFIVKKTPPDTVAANSNSIVLASPVAFY